MKKPKKIKFSMEALNPLIERIEKLSTIQRVLIYAGTFIVLIGGTVYLAYMPKWDKVAELESKLETLETQLLTARREASALPRLKKEMEEKKGEYKMVSKALPERTEIPSLLTSISNSGREAGLDFLLFQPGGVTSKDFYAEIPVSINVIGSYHHVAEFFDRVASLSRIVNIKNITMAPAKENELNVTCTAVTYQFIEKQE